jgi:hypothetical protein
MEEKAQNIQSGHPRTYLKDMSTGSISMICSAATVESSISFRASLSLQVAAKPSPAASKLAWGYKDFRILRLRLTDCFMLAIIISRDLVGRLSREAVEELLG